MPRGTRWATPTIACVLFAVAVAQPPAPSPGVLRGANDATAQRLREIESRIPAGKWPELIQDLQRVADESGDHLVPQKDGQYLPASVIARRVIARLPEPARALYRDRADGTARALLRNAKTRRDLDALESIGREYPSTPSADEALEFLGDIAFDLGDFDRAERAWRDLRSTRPAEADARLLLLIIHRRRFDEATAALPQFRKRHPTAAGHLAGRDGPFAETLAAVLAAEQNNKVTPVDSFRESRWTTFAADGARDGAIRDGLPLYWPILPTWELPLPGTPRDEPVIGDQHPRSLAFFPVAIGDTAYLADACRVFALPLVGGNRRRLIHDVRSEERKADADTDLPVQSDSRFTLTTADGMLFARLGSATTKDATPSNWLVGFGSLGGAAELSPFWHLAPPEADASWEGAPLVADRRMYAAFSRVVGDRFLTSLACYAGLTEVGEQPELVWKREAFASPISPEKPPTRHELPTLAGPNVVFASHTGGVVALSKLTGRPAWAFRYEPSDAKHSGYRDLCPPTFADGKVFVAPNDSTTVYCLDASTGERLWERSGIEVVQVLGVAGGRLIVTTGGPVHGIRGLNLTSGVDHGDQGWTQHDDGGVATFGRGFIAGEVVFWPTRAGTFVLSAATGEPLRGVIPDMAGNLAFANGVMIATTPTAVRGYVSERRFLAERQKASLAAPDDALIRYRFALALADARRDNEARRAFEVVERGPIPGLAQSAARRRSGLDGGKVVDLIPHGEGPRTPRQELGTERPAARPALAIPAIESWGIEVETHQMPLISLADRFVCAGDGAVTCRRSDNGERIWSRELPFQPQVAFDLGDSVIVAGTGGLARLGTADGAVDWSLHESEAEPLFRTLDESDTRRPWSAFRLAGSVVVAKWGRDRLVAVDVATGAIKWRVEAGGLGTVRFDAIHATGRFVLVRRTDGNVIIIETATGKVRETNGIGDSLVPWAGSAVALDGDRMIVGTATDRVQLVNLAVGQPIWTHRIDGDVGLTGACPKLIRVGNGVLCLVERNHGCELEYLSLITGQSQWRRPAFLGIGAIDPEAIAVVDDVVIVPTGERCIAIRLDTGARAWSVSPGIECRRTVVTTSAVLVFPSEAKGREIRSWTGDLGFGLLRRVVAGYDDYVGRTFPVLAIDPRDGRVVQRMAFPSIGSGAGVWAGQSGVVVATGGNLWGLK